MKKNVSNTVVIVVKNSAVLNPAQRALITDDLIEYAQAVASQYAGNGPFRDDIIQDAACSLIDAAMAYNPLKGASFKTFATYYIKKAVIRGLKCYNRVRAPKSLRMEVKMLSLDALIDRNAACLDSRDDDDTLDIGDENPFFDALIDMDELNEREKHEMLVHFLSLVDPESKVIIEAHFGINGKKLSFDEIAIKLGLSGCTVRDKFNQAMGKLTLAAA